jgi:putative restriction endonuclease
MERCILVKKNQQIAVVKCQQTQMQKSDWTREQTVVALNLYCKIPFNRVSSNHPEIVKIAPLIGRSPNSVKMKIGNFGSFDEELKKRGIVGLSNASKLDKEVWDEFNRNWDSLAYESEGLIAKFASKPIEDIAEIDVTDFPVGTERLRLIKQRVNQNFFRATVLSSYNIKCCITQLSVPSLLSACHIMPWKDSIENRLNPHNGLCLNEFHHKAFDQGYITIGLDFKIRVSAYFKDFKKDKAVSDYILQYENASITLPDKFSPKIDFLVHHNENIFIQ